MNNDMNNNMSKQDAVNILFDGQFTQEQLKKELQEIAEKFVVFYLDGAEDTSLNGFVSEKVSVLSAMIASL